MKTSPRSFPRPRRPALVTPGEGVEMAASRSDFVRRGALAILAFGVALRLMRYFADRSLWLDESLLTINLMTRSYRELLETLDYNQGAPIAFLWIERLMLDLFGDSEYSLRVFPLLIGICSLILFYLVVRELLTPVGSLVALLLFATIEPFVRYSAEAKQYGLDVAITLGLLYLFMRLVESGELSRWSTLLLAVVGPLAVSLSHPSAFVLSGLAIGGLYAAVSSGNVKGLVRQAIAYGIWLLSFLVVYLVAIRDLGDLQDTVRGIGATPRERVKNLYTIFSDPGEFPRTTVGLAATVSLVGIICLWRRRRPVVVVFATTAAAVFVAGSLGLYPVGQRFLLFLFPIVVICLAEGITRIGGIRPPVLAIGLLVGVAALIVGPVVGTAAKRFVVPPKGEHIESLLREVETNWQPGDVLYLYPDSQYAFRYYAECDDCGAVTSRARELWPSHPTAGGQPQTTPAIVSDSSSLVVGDHGEALPESLAGKRRVWLLYTHFFPRTEQQLLDEADSRGKRITCSHGGASLLCLYDLS